MIWCVNAAFVNVKYEGPKCREQNNPQITSFQVTHLTSNKGTTWKSTTYKASGKSIKLFTTGYSKRCLHFGVPVKDRAGLLSKV